MKEVEGLGEANISLNESAEPALRAFDTTLKKSQKKHNRFTDKSVKATKQIIIIKVFWKTSFCQWEPQKNIKLLPKNYEKNFKKIEYWQWLKF